MTALVTWEKTEKPKRAATVIALSRHRAIVQGYETILANHRSRYEDTKRLFEVERQNSSIENGRLVRRNIQLKNQLEAKEETECTPFWAVVWTVVGAIAVTTGFVCLSLLVWP
jgi:hypothetical protein